MNQYQRPNNRMVIEDDDYYRKPPKSGAKKALIAILIILALAVVGIVVYFVTDISKIWNPDLGFDENAVIFDDEPDPDAADLPAVTFNNPNVQVAAKPADAIDILLIGVDNRNITKFTGRSDVLMVVRVNTKTRELKLVSFMRDTLVAIDGHGNNRINAAYNYGSVELAYHTMAQNFGVRPDHYMVVNFYGMEDIIDAMGGVTVHVEDNEVKYINGSVAEQNAHDPDGKSSKISDTGDVTLNGRQAVAYMRIRKVGGDSARVGRQQEVLQGLFSKMASVDLGQIPGLIGTLADYVRTDVPLGQMIDLAKAMKNMQGSGLETMRYPQDYKNGNYEGRSIVTPKDVDAEIQALHDFLG